MTGRKTANHGGKAGVWMKTRMARKGFVALLSVSVILTSVLKCGFVSYAEAPDSVVTIEQSAEESTVPEDDALSGVELTAEA